MPVAHNLRNTEGDLTLSTNVRTLDRDVTKLHMSFRERAEYVVRKSAEEGSPFGIFEAWRTPARQAYLLTQGKHVTRAGAWLSFHQYGLAADFAGLVNGQLSQAPNLQWTRLHEIGAEVGLHPLTFETGHLQLGPNKAIHLMRENIDRILATGETIKGLEFMDGGGESWAANMRLARNGAQGAQGSSGRRKK